MDVAAEQAETVADVSEPVVVRPELGERGRVSKRHEEPRPADRGAAQLGRENRWMAPERLEDPVALLDLRLQVNLARIELRERSVLIGRRDAGKRASPGAQRHLVLRP